VREPRGFPCTSRQGIHAYMLHAVQLLNNTRSKRLFKILLG
jgi:hypothetical protein